MQSISSPTNENRESQSSSAPRGLAVLTESHFFKYAACPHWIWFDHFGDPAKRRPPPAVNELFRATVAANRSAVIRKAFKRYRIREVTATGPEAAFDETLLRMKEGTDVIANGTLCHEHWFGHPDLLLRRRGSSALGLPHYLPALVARGTRAGSLQKLLLAFWATLLENIQGLRPDTGFVIAKDGKREIVPLERVLPRFKETASAIEAILAGSRPAPFLSGGCRESPWFSECVRLAEESKDLTLIAGLNRSVVQSLRAQGILSIDDAHAINPKAILGKASGLTRSALIRIKDQARALLNREVIVHKRYRFPSAKTELFLDLEGDPLRGIDYLIGVLIVDGRGARYQPFFAERPEEEREMWRAFLAWIKKLPLNTRIYHYGHYERQKLGGRRYQNATAAAALSLSF